MKSFLQREEFNQQVTDDISGFFNRQGKDIGQLQKRILLRK
jgi:hypothetical protein